MRVTTTASGEASRRRRVATAGKRAERERGVQIARRWAVAYTAYMRADVMDRVAFIAARDALHQVESELASYAACNLLPHTEWLAASNSFEAFEAEEAIRA